MSEPIFVLELPLELAPTMNVFCNMKPWQKAKVRQGVDAVIATAVFRAGRETPACETKRKAVVTRYSSRQPDEIASDIVGGKVPIDRLVRAGILAGDSAKWLERETHWVRSKPGDGKVVVAVYDF